MKHQLGSPLVLALVLFITIAEALGFWPGSWGFNNVHLCHLTSHRLLVPKLKKASEPRFPKIILAWQKIFYNFDDKENCPVYLKICKIISRQNMVSWNFQRSDSIEILKNSAVGSSYSNGGGIQTLFHRALFRT